MASIELPLVSVVTPSLNQGQFIAETVNSVLSQDYPRLEYLVVDGGSTDKTLDILRCYGERLHWISESDNGQTAAINKGWRLAQGEIIAWLNSDDTYLPGAVKRAVSFLQAHPAVDAVYGDCDYVDGEGRFLRAYPARPYDYVELVRSAFDYIPQPATFIRRRALESVGHLDESLHYVMDLDYWLRLGVRHAMTYLPERLATLRLHQTAKSIQQVGDFPAELIYTYQRLFALPDLPRSVREIETEAMSNVYYAAAYCAFWSGRPQEARHYGLLAWRRYRKFRRLLPLIAMGKLGLIVAEKWRGNPFDPHAA